ncbi:MAG TPA: ATP-binding cassette domain-containing protein [Candidatus Krumholzibacteria bacterium]|nr:ATP-binding cassette domain-containing protein [Candidatus Krumholzibacteria bacterium]
MDPILQLLGVKRSFGSIRAVDGVDLSVPRGAIYGILGPNGAGKTTTIRMILNIYIPDEGKILFDGGRLDRHAINHIGYLPEERGLYKRMRVEEHVVYLARLKGVPTAEAKRRARLWLERFGLDDRASAKTDELSKGMQQKVQFIGTVISEPQMVVLDEPFSGLDPINVKLLREIIEEIRAAGRTVLFSTHVMEQAEQICDHIFLINDGRKVLDGKLEDIVENYPVDNVRVSGEFEAQTFENIAAVDSTKRNGNEMLVRLKDGFVAQDLLLELVKRGRVDRFAAARPPLSEIFIREVERSRE